MRVSAAEAQQVTNTDFILTKKGKSERWSPGEYENGSKVRSSDACGNRPLRRSAARFSPRPWRDSYLRGRSRTSQTGWAAKSPAIIPCKRAKNHPSTATMHFTEEYYATSVDDWFSVMQQEMSAWKHFFMGIVTLLRTSLRYFYPLVTSWTIAELRSPIHFLFRPVPSCLFPSSAFHHLDAEHDDWTERNLFRPMTHDREGNQIWAYLPTFSAKNTKLWIFANFVQKFCSFRAQLLEENSWKDQDFQLKSFKKSR